MSFTVKNLREVEDMAAKHGFGDAQEARFAHEDLEAESIGISLQRVKPGKRHAFAHRHKSAEEVYVVLSGTGRVKIDDEVTDVGPLDAIRIASQAGRAFEADGEGLELLVFSPRAEDDAEIIKEDFWGD